MLETSRDLLNIMIAFAVLWVTVFVCWALYYVISMMRSVSRITGGVRKKMETVDKILDLVKEKLEKGSNHFGMMADSVIKLVGYVMDKQKDSSSKKSKSKKK